MEKVNNVLCFGESSGSIIINVTNSFQNNTNPPNGPFSYSINDQQEFSDDFSLIAEENYSFIVDNLPQGEYTINLKDGNDCITSSDVVVVDEPSELIFDSIDNTNVSCFGYQDGKLYSECRGLSNYNISIDGGNTFIETNNEGSFTASYLLENIQCLWQIKIIAQLLSLYL